MGTECGAKYENGMGDPYDARCQKPAGHSEAEHEFNYDQGDGVHFQHSRWVSDPAPGPHHDHGHSHGPGGHSHKDWTPDRVVARMQRDGFCGHVTQNVCMERADREHEHMAAAVALHTVPLSLLSRALDEIFALRSLVAYEAQVREADMDYKTYPKSRRKVGERRVEVLRLAAQGKWRQAAEVSYLSLRHARRAAGMPDLLTRETWEVEDGR